MAESASELAIQLMKEAYIHQMQGDLQRAVELYKLSIDIYPTDEAHTFFGWTYRFMGKFEYAIAECKKAIEVDPSFGNPYNDIGAYLIELGELDNAIPWLEKATLSERYEAYHYPWYNLGRVYVAKELYSMGRACFKRSLEIEPRYTLAEEALAKVRRLLQ
jgi:tetratricopeptide (TPR) repeat protein